MDILEVVLLILLNLQALLLVVANGLPAIKRYITKEKEDIKEIEKQKKIAREMQNFFSYTGDSQKDEQ